MYFPEASVMKCATSLALMLTGASTHVSIAKLSRSAAGGRAVQRGGAAGELLLLLRLLPPQHKLRAHAQALTT